MDRSTDLIQYVLKHARLSQAELARTLKVTPAQISKWKAGDYISSERTSELLKLAGLFDTVNVEWAIFAKSAENADAWYSYVFEILDNVEWGHSLKDFFHDMPDVYVAHLITDLRDLGAKIEQQSPEVRSDGEDCEPTPLECALYSILETWGQLKDWSDDTLEFDDVSDDVDSELFEHTQELEWLTFDLALDHVETAELAAIGVNETKLNELVSKSRKEIKEHLRQICQIRTKHGLPITEDYFELLYLPPEDLAEQSWFRPLTSGAPVDENVIKSCLPYGERLILLHLENSARVLRRIEEKIDRICQKSSSCD